MERWGFKLSDNVDYKHKIMQKNSLKEPGNTFFLIELYETEEVIKQIVLDCWDR